MTAADPHLSRRLGTPSRSPRTSSLPMSSDADARNSTRAEYHDVEVLRRAFPILVVLAVLVQYTPLRICALESVAFGSSCHDRGDHAILGDANDESRPCVSS